jgi:5-methylcytosine-specific restriction endonuclease McrA
MKPNTKCNNCELLIYRKPNLIKKGPVFCSIKCSSYRFKKIKYCVVCNTEITGRRNSITCSRKCSNINRYGIRYFKESPKDQSKKNQRLKNQLLKIKPPKCNRCEFNIIEIIQVHHIIEKSKGGSDDLSNLELLCPNCHALHHYYLRLNAKMLR